MSKLLLQATYRTRAYKKVSKCCPESLWKIPVTASSKSEPHHIHPEEVGGNAVGKKFDRSIPSISKDRVAHRPEQLDSQQLSCFFQPHRYVFNISRLPAMPEDCETSTSQTCARKNQTVSLQRGHAQPLSISIGIPMIGSGRNCKDLLFVIGANGRADDFQ